MKKRKVLFVTHYSSLHGANLSLIELIKGLRQKYNILPVVLLPSDGKIIKNLEQYDIEYIVIKFRPWMWRWSNKKLLNQLKNYSLQKKSLYNACRLLKNKKIDIIHTNTSVTPFGVFLSKKINAKHVWHIREFGREDFDLKNVYPSFYSDKWYNKSDAIIYISKAIKEHFGMSNNIIKPIEKLIYNGIMFNRFRPYEKLQDFKKPFNFIYSAYNSEGKNQLEALRAVNRLKDQTKKPFQITFVGGHEPDEGYRSKMMNYISDNKLEKYVIILDYVEDIGAIYEKGDVGILCSKSEGFGRVIIEYYYYQMPVIVSNSGALPELIDKNIDGLIYELGDIAEMTSHMLWMLNNQNKVKEMGQKGKQKAIDNYQVERVVDEVFELYTKI